MSGKLSERFQELKTAGGSNAKIKNSNRQKRSVNQQQQRGTKFNQRRGIVTNNSTNSTSVNKTGRRATITARRHNNAKVRIAKPNSANIQTTDNRRRGRKPGGKVAGNRRNINNTKKGPVTGQELDKELDSYWYAAGKGPNPEVASLDREMDDYFKTKPTEEHNEIEGSS